MRNKYREISDITLFFKSIDLPLLMQLLNTWLLFLHEYRNILVAILDRYTY